MAGDRDRRQRILRASATGDRRRHGGDDLQYDRHRGRRGGAGVQPDQPAGAGRLQVDALLAKNMIYFFGHVFINASIYMAVTAVYEIIPEYTGTAMEDDPGLRARLERHPPVRDGGLSPPPPAGHGDARHGCTDDWGRWYPTSAAFRCSRSPPSRCAYTCAVPGMTLGPRLLRCSCCRWPAGRSASMPGRPSTG